MQITRVSLKPNYISCAAASTKGCFGRKLSHYRTHGDRNSGIKCVATAVALLNGCPLGCLLTNRRKGTVGGWCSIIAVQITTASLKPKHVTCDTASTKGDFGRKLSHYRTHRDRNSAVQITTVSLKPDYVSCAAASTKGGFGRKLSHYRTHGDRNSGIKCVAIGAALPIGY
ncbi:hypothetical protein CEXT_538151 [Caerostris extrusa]|uniref:Uncharacterized protein n=1 Tax=Caerostris extrusa TaxID=172846 RepID=A0AAV4RCK2_CAEEX|nr:hypothetical protein CEXT_538151 [Caerostris extrusa]